MGLDLNLKDVAGAAIASLANSVPVVSTAAEFLSRLDDTRDRNQVVDRLHRVETEMDALLNGCHEDQMDRGALVNRMRQMLETQQRHNAIVCGGLISDTTHYETMRKHPDMFGEPLTMDSQTEYDPDNVHLMIQDPDGNPMMLKMPVFSFFQLIFEKTNRTETKTLNGDGVVSKPVMLEIEDIEPGTALFICTQEKANDPQVRKLIDGLKDTYGINVVFPEQLIPPGFFRYEAYDKIAHLLHEKQLRPFLIADGDIQTHEEYRIVSQMQQLFQGYGVMPVVHHDDIGKDIDGIGDYNGNVTWNTAAAYTVDRKMTPEKIRIFASAILGIRPYELERMEKRGITDFKPYMQGVDNLREEPPESKL
ncbi:MAG: hypothetical protein OXU45_08860 [Candidatus Melainabacteria bacterium]|nr:hypothetical protein [Candidatus Melainabacteria bacterium]